MVNHSRWNNCTLLLSQGMQQIHADFQTETYLYVMIVPSSVCKLQKTILKKE